MINKQNGEVTVDLDGTAYTFALTLSAMATLEEMFSVKFDEFVKQAEAGSMKHLQAFMWAALQKHHRDLSLQEAGDLVTVATLQRLTKSLLDVTESSTPDPDDARELMGSRKQPNPTKARTRVAGTGESSISRLAVSG